MILINGKSLAQKIREDVQQECARLDHKPGLAVILVGNDPASHLYVNLKEKAAAEAGIHFEKFLFEEETEEKTITELIQTLNIRNDIDAILIQLPLPTHLNEDRIIATVDPYKDVDGFHPKTIASLSTDHPIIIPGLVAGILTMIESVEPTISHKNVTILANNHIFAAPFLPLLAKQGARGQWVSPTDPELTKKISSADILIVAIGRANFITKEMIKPGAIIIDVGTNRVDNQTIGDVNAQSVEDVARALSPVPGGVGPMTVAMLLKNTLELAKKH